MSVSGAVYRVVNGIAVTTEKKAVNHAERIVRRAGWLTGAQRS